MTQFLPATVPARDSDGNIIASSTWSFYYRDSLVPAETSAGQQVTSDSAGDFAAITFEADVTLRAVLKDADGKVIYDIGAVVDKLFSAAFKPALNDALVASGARWNFYLTGTTTPATVYSDDTLTVARGPVVQADAAGRFPPIYLDDAVSYKAVLLDMEGTQLGAIDPVTYNTMRVYLDPTADATAPTLSSPTDAANGQTGATLSVSTNEGNGTLYFYVSTSATPPSAADLKASTGDVVGGSQVVTTTGVQNVSFPTGLTASTLYYTHYLHRDAAGNDSAIVTADGFTTEAAPDTSPVLPHASWSGTAGSGFTTTPTDPTRTTAKPVCRLMVPPNQYFTDELVIGVFAAANNAGSLATKLGLQKVTLYYEGTTRDIVEPSVYTFNDVNGVSRSYLGWWATIKKPTGTAGHANVYFEAVPADATMQNRVIGPYQFSPQTSLHDLSIEVTPSLAVTAGVRYQTIAAALAYCRTSTANNPLITITEAHPSGKYDILPNGGVYDGEGFATIVASVPIVIGKAAYVDETATNISFRSQWEGLHFKGSNITFDWQYVDQIYHELPANRRHWLDGVTIMNTAGRYALKRGMAQGSTPMIREGGYMTECTVSNVQCPAQGLELARGNTFTSIFADVAVDCLNFVGNVVDDHSSEEYRNNLAAFTIDGPAGATIELSGANAAATRTFTAKESGTTVGTFAVVNTYAGFTANTNYTIANVVAWINTLSGWTGTVLDNTRAAMFTGISGAAGAAFGAQSCSSPLTLYTMIDQHADVWGNQSSLENLICYGNRCWDVNAQGIYIAVTNSKDVLIANNALRGLNGNYQSQFAGVQSNVIYAHNSITGQYVVLRKDTTYNPDARCGFLNNACERIAYNTGTTDADLIIANNHFETGASVPGGAGVSGTTIGGTTATLYADAANGNFAPAGALLTNLKTAVLSLDLARDARATSDAAGAVGA